MSKSPHPENTSQSSANKRFWFMLLRICGIGIGGILLVGLTLGAWRLRNFIENELAPLAEQNLKTTLKRPIELGKVKEFSLTGVKFAASAVPATANDPDRVTIDAVEVGFDPLQLLFNRTLKLDVTLVNPNIYVEQDAQGRWVTTSLPQTGPPGAIKTELEKIRIRNATLVLKSQETKKSVSAGQVAANQVVANQDKKNQVSGGVSPSGLSSTYTQLNGTAELLENNQKIKFNVEGEAVSGGNIALNGEARTKAQEIDLQVKAKDLLAVEVTRVVPLPVKLEAGKLDSDIKVQFKPKKFPLVFGTATAKALQLQVPRVPLPFSNSQGNLSFQGTSVTLENVSSNYGKIPLIAKGKIDKDKGFNLAARINRVSANNALSTLKVKSPLPTSGEYKADLQVTGLINNPTISGNVASVQPAKIDKVDIESVSTKFVFAPVASLITLKNIQAKPKLGGDISGGGTISIGKNARIDINYTAKNLPGDNYANLYEANTGITLNTISATGQITGPVGDVQTIVNFQAPQATYPATGQINIAANRTVTFRNIALNVAGGKVLANG
ncbi:MAG: DUF748 domain-containing protein [Calothrix sp. SM1_7_51]|nr:DUF748 domain-containing protein [Calothrix sp. SM1_7_51]